MLIRQALYVAERRTITFRNTMNHSDPDGYIAALSRRMAAIMETKDLENEVLYLHPTFLQLPDCRKTKD